MTVRGVAALAICAGLASGPALASTIVVPDDAPTVQMGIDSGADTVQIRMGTYSERPLVDHPVTLEGIAPGARPSVSGLQIHNTNFWVAPRLLTLLTAA